MKKRGRPKVDIELEQLVVKLALENPNDGYPTLVGKLRLLGFLTNSETIQNILKRNGIPPAPDRKDRLSWEEFLEIHWKSLAATDFFTWEILTPFGLITYYILFFIRLKSREVHISGITPNPNENWMRQMARNLTDTDKGFIRPNDILFHDRDAKYTAHFDRLLNETGIKTMKLPPESPNLNAYAERFVRTVKDQCLTKLIITSEEQLRTALKEYLEFYHHERSHQGLGNIIPFPRKEDRVGCLEGRIVKRSRLGNLLNSYFRVQNDEKPFQDQEKVAI